MTKTAKKTAKKTASRRELPPSIDKKRVFKYVDKHPGTSAELVREALKDLEPKQVSYLLRKLRDSGHIAGHGVTRSMTYRPTGKALG
jgi:predicted transcriptional regulator